MGMAEYANKSAFTNVGSLGLSLPTPVLDKDIFFVIKVITYSFFFSTKILNKDVLFYVLLFGSKYMVYNSCVWVAYMYEL